MRTCRPVLPDWKKMDGPCARLNDAGLVGEESGAEPGSVGPKVNDGTDADELTDPFDDLPEREGNLLDEPE